MVEVAMPGDENKDLEEWKRDSEFLAFLKSEKGISDITPENAEAIKEAHKEYEERKKQQEGHESDGTGSGEEATGGHQDDDKGALSVGQEPGGEENGDNVEHDAAKVGRWKEFADANGYTFEEKNEPEYAYSVVLGKSGKTSSIKGKDNNLYVKSEDLNIYREIVRQAKEDNYSSINCMDSLDEKQKHMLLYAAIEHDMEIENAPAVLDISQLGISQIPAEMNDKILKHTYKSLMKSLEKNMLKFKEDHPNDSYKVARYSAGNVTRETNRAYMAMQVYIAAKNGIKLEPGDIISLSEKDLKLIPVENKEEFRNIINSYNKANADVMFKSALKAVEEGKKANNDGTAAPYFEIKKEDIENNPNMAMALFAACVKQGITPKMPEGIHSIHGDIRLFQEEIGSLYIKGLREMYTNSTDENIKQRRADREFLRRTSSKVYKDGKLVDSGVVLTDDEKKHRAELLSPIQEAINKKKNNTH